MRADALATADAFLDLLSRQEPPGLRLGPFRHGTLTARLDGLAHRSARRWAFHGAFHHRGGRRDLAFAEGDQTFARAASPQLTAGLALLLGPNRRLHLRRCDGLLLVWSEIAVRLVARAGRPAAVAHRDLDPGIADALTPHELVALAKGLRRLLAQAPAGRHALWSAETDSAHTRLAAEASLAAFSDGARAALARLTAAGHRPEVLAAEGRALLLLPPRLPPLAAPTVLASAHAD